MSRASGAVSPELIEVPKPAAGSLPGLPVLRRVAAAAAVAVLYAAAARLGMALAFPALPISVLWLPNAVLLATLLLAPRRDWWLYLGFGLLAHLLVQPLLFDAALSLAFVNYAFNCLTALAGALALQALAPGLLRLERMRAAAVFLVTTGFLTPLCVSLVAAAALVAVHATTAFWATALLRALTNSFAILTVVPLALHGAAWLRAGNLTIRADRAAEACMLGLTLVALSLAAFVLPPVAHDLFPALLYAPYAVLLWAAARFGVAGACSSVLVLGLAASWGALRQAGPFAGLSPFETAVSLQVFLVLTCVSLLLLAVALTERRFLEQAGAASESGRRQAQVLHSAVLASLHGQIVVLDQAGTIIETNQSWRRSAGHPASGPLERLAVGEHYLEACSSALASGDRTAGEILACVREVLAGGSTRRDLELSRDSPQALLWQELSVERLNRPQGGAVITRTDITARKQAIDQAREQRAQLAHLGRAAVLGELSGAFAHELVQPLTSILGNAEAALQLLPPDTPGGGEIREMLRDIIKDDVRAAEVIQRLRSMLSRGEIRRQPVDLNHIVRDVLALARADLLTRNVSVQTELETDIGRVLADPVQLQQVLLNLIVNASEAMVGNTPAERMLTIATRSAGDGQAVECTVADRGCGIRPEELERIFQPFVTTKQQGLGLGLAICRSIIEAHGGRLWAENAPSGRGAILHFTAGVG
jgi:signal transduction histidine kinase